jgi:hypothetical protein
MKRLIPSLMLLFVLPVTGDTPDAVFMDFAVTFDANRIASGTFTATGAISDHGTFIDTPRPGGGLAIHGLRLMTTSAGEYITIKLNATFVNDGSKNPPTWCPAPPPVPGTNLVSLVGTMQIVSGTGPYATLQGTGAWATWVTAAGPMQPLSAKECFSGTVHYL